MARVKNAVNAAKKRRVILERAEGYRGQRSRLYRKAKEQVTHSLVYAYRDRRAKKGEFRALWIQRITAAARAEGLTDNRFVQGLARAGIEAAAAMRAVVAGHVASAFSSLLASAKEALPTDVNAPRASCTRPATAASAAKAAGAAFGVSDVHRMFTSRVLGCGRDR